MVSRHIKQSALNRIRARHPTIDIQAIDGVVRAPAASRLFATRQLALHHASKRVFHPIAGYNRSISRVSRRAAAFADQLFTLEKSFRDRLLNEAERSAIGRELQSLLDKYESYLFAVDAHFDDLKNTASAFFVEPIKKITAVEFLHVRAELEAISEPTSYVVNKIKHNSATLTGFHSVAANSQRRFWVPGFVLEVVEGEVVGADPAFRGFEDSAISMFGDLRRTICSVIVGSRCLDAFMEARGVEPVSDFEGVGSLNELADILLSTSQLVYPSERHEFYCNLTLPDFTFKREPMPCSMRDAPPPPDLVGDDWSLMSTGDGYTRSFKLPRPIRITG